MRQVLFNKDCEATLTKVAEQFGVDTDKLFEIYLAVIKSNYEQDLWDIASENEEELRGDK